MASYKTKPQTFKWLDRLQGFWETKLTLVLHHIPREQETTAAQLFIIPAEPFMPPCCVTPALLVLYYSQECMPSLVKNNFNTQHIIYIQLLRNNKTKPYSTVNLTRLSIFSTQTARGLMSQLSTSHTSQGCLQEMRKLYKKLKLDLQCDLVRTNSTRTTYLTPTNVSYTSLAMDGSFQFPTFWMCQNLNMWTRRLSAAKWQQ